MTSEVIDRRGYRLNVGIVIMNQQGNLLWCRRIGHVNAWQFPQGGILRDETPKEAMYRELSEELGLTPNDVECLAETSRWLSYRLPRQYRRYKDQPLCVGQTQKWFLLRLLVDDSYIQLERSENPEFNRWRWVRYWYPLKHVISFKRHVYRKVLQEFDKVQGPC